MLTPDTAHGTNPASVTMAGYEVVKVATNERGGVEMDDLRAKVSDDVACLMLTNPNTLGLFDENIAEIAAPDPRRRRHALLRRRQPQRGDGAVAARRHGLRHRPRQPAQVVQPAPRRRRPGAGPIAVSERIEPFLPRPQVVRREGANGSGRLFDLDYDRPKSIGRLRGFQGNFGVFVRSYAYILSLGSDGLAEASETAVLNANYLKARLAEGRAGRYLPIAFDRPCMHEFVLSGKPMKRELGLATLDLAKRLLDFDFHPPTVYFPLLVDEALMIEPTETETKESLDAFADAVEEILEEAERRPGDRTQRPLHHPGAPPRRGRGRPAARSSASHWADASHAASPQSVGSFCFSSSTGANRSPWRLHALEDVIRLEASEPGSSRSSGALDLVPFDRGRDGRTFAGAQRVDGDRRLATVVLCTSRRRPCPSPTFFHPRYDLIGSLLLQ